VAEGELCIPAMTVCAGIWSKSVTGPFLIRGTVITNSYLELLQCTRMLETEQHHVLENVVWQQGGAAPYFEQSIDTFLTKKVPVWLCCCGSVKWPPRFPRFTSCGFSMWGVIKD
jgi:hypothetical protein